MPDPGYGRMPYETLRAEILRLDLVPGERLTERGLEGRFEASRTPIRAALFRLEGEGLTQREGRGWRVAPIDITEIRAIAEYREVIESAAAHLVVTRASDEDLAGLAGFVEAVDDDSEEGGLRAGADFHIVLARLSANPFFVSAMESVMTRLARTRYLEVRTPERRAAARAEHRAIAAALIARNGSLAEALLTAHSRGTMDRLLEHLRDEQRRMRGRGLSIVESGAHPSDTVGGRA